MEVRLGQFAPGKYEGRLEIGPDAAAVAVRDSSGRTVWQGATAATCSPELSAIGPNWENLRRLAELTGGKIIGPSELAGLVRTEAAGQSMPLWPWLAAAALTAMLLDWVTVRIVRRP